MEIITRELRAGLPLELLYADDIDVNDARHYEVKAEAKV